MKTKKGEKEKLRLVILDKAIAYFKKHGRGGIASDEIMSYMGLTRGALYSHFKSKDDLFAYAVSHDLKRLEETIAYRLLHNGPLALQKLIESHLSEKSLVDIEGGCAFTSLSSDMQRCKAAHRGMYESSMNRIYDLFAEGFRQQFPESSHEQLRFKALNLYSGLVGTLTMARTMKDPAKAKEILDAGKKFLVENLLESSR